MAARWSSRVWGRAVLLSGGSERIFREKLCGALRERAKLLTRCQILSKSDRSARVFSASAGPARGLNEAWFLSLADARRIIEAWRPDYNTVRPHSALGDLTPADFEAARP